MRTSDQLSGSGDKLPTLLNDTIEAEQPCQSQGFVIN
jgi:hypothetical protein